MNPEDIPPTLRRVLVEFGEIDLGDDKYLDRILEGLIPAATDLPPYPPEFRYAWWNRLYDRPWSKDLVSEDVSMEGLWNDWSNTSKEFLRLMQRRESDTALLQRYNLLERIILALCDQQERLTAAINLCGQWIQEAEKLAANMEFA